MDNVLPAVIAIALFFLLMGDSVHGGKWYPVGR